jgi:hypothetical protein
MISLNSLAFLSLNICARTQYNPNNNHSANFSAHQEWNHHSGWKNTLNNISLVIPPILLFWLIYPGLQIFPNSNLLLGFKHLIDAMNQFQLFYSSA